MKTNRILACFLSMVIFAGGCASTKPAAPAPISVGEGEIFTPIRTKYKVLRPAELPSGVDTLQLAVVDVRFDGGQIGIGFLPGQYRVQSGFCQIPKARVEVASLAELVTAMDPYIDRMPFAVLFTCNGRATSDPAVVDSLPEAYTDFFQEFQAVMREEDIDFVCLLPDKITFLK